VICNKGDWCARTEDGRVVICRRSSQSSALGPGKERVDQAGNVYWLYRQGGPTAPTWPAPVYTVADGKGERADPDILHQVYSAFLQALPLTHEHRRNLRQRGLTDNLIDQFGYKSLGRSRAKTVQGLISAGLEQHLPRVPGFHIKTREEDGTSYWTVAGPSGILIPIRDSQRRIIALMVRADDKEVDDAGKYTFLSSRKQGGPGPGSPVHVPLHNFTDTTTMRVTEGALKSDIATALSGLLTIGLPGVAARKRTAGMLNELGAQTARLALDADARANRTVATALARLAKDLQAKGVPVELELWNMKDGKGIDDLLAGGKKPQVLIGDAVPTAIREIRVAAAKADPLPSGDVPDGQPLEADDDPHRLARLFKQCWVTSLDQ
jgi:hypothetical protein